MQTILTILGLAILFSAAIAGVSAAPWLPTKPKDRRHLLDEFQLLPGQRVVDLGCGDGSLLFAVVRKFPDAVCVGYEISLLPLFFAWARKYLRPRLYKNVSIRFGNLFTQSLKEFDVIFVFLLAKSYPRLIERFKAEAKDNAQIIVEAWPLPDLQPEKQLKKEGHLSLYFYSGKGISGVK